MRCCRSEASASAVAAVHRRRHRPSAGIAGARLGRSQETSTPICCPTRPSRSSSPSPRRAVMPVIFAELAAHYPPHKVRDQNSGIVAANGQYILVRRAAYEAVGGHAAVATEILEDVALARRFRNAGMRVHFRYGGDAVRTPACIATGSSCAKAGQRIWRCFSHNRNFWLPKSALWLVAWWHLP